MDLVASAEASEQFVCEMEAMASLNHPNVVKWFDGDKIEDTFYCAMEFVEGTDLGKLVRSKGPLPVTEACDYIRQTAKGLQHAYERNLIHRDIKPVNLILTKQRLDPTVHRREAEEVSLIKILDWGLANLSPPRSQLGDRPSSPQCTGLVGTADYLSPEQAMDPDSVDIRGDIYSLGCTFYFLLTGQPPFVDGTLMQKIMYHQSREPLPVESLRLDVPVGLEAIIKRMMAKKPGDRYQTPGAVATALIPYTQSRKMPLPRRPQALQKSTNPRNTPLPRPLYDDTETGDTSPKGVDTMKD
jgi:serine/threonine-protein kinase